MASFSNALFQCTKCHSSFNSNVELLTHIDNSECHGIADSLLDENYLADNNSDSDWEYEYSKTETETFYVTLDLPVARSDANIEAGAKGGRLTKRKDKWLNSTHIPFVDEKRKTQTVRTEIMKSRKNVLVGNETGAPKKKNTTPATANGGEAAGNVTDGDADGEADEAPLARKESRTNGTKITAQMSQRTGELTLDKATSGFPATAAKEFPHDIQILELHNKNPIVIYRSQQFECDWTENIGTELLFIKHSDIIAKPDANPPIVKSLPGEVDLLAVSGVRVVGHPINIKAKEDTIRNATKEKAKAEALPTTTRRLSDPRSESDFVRPEGPLQIPIGPGAGDDRKEQVRFLEKLAAIKFKRGEHDEVTVNAVPRKVNRERKDRDLKRQRAEKILQDSGSSERRKAFARRRIEEIDALNANAGGGFDRRAAKSNGRQMRNSVVSDMALSPLRSGLDENEKMRTHAGSSRTVISSATNGNVSNTQHRLGPSKQQQDPYTDEDGDDEDEGEDEDSSELNSSDDDESDPEDEENSNMNDDEDGIHGFENEQDVDMEEENVVYTPRDEDYDMDEEEEYSLAYGGFSGEGFHPQDRDMDIDMDDAV